MAPPSSSQNPAARLMLLARQSELDNVKTTFTSWDGCMAKSYCKWPVIAAIIIGSLIVLSIVFCVVRCCCCGVECCCACCSVCNKCCPSPRNKRRSYQPAPSQPYSSHGYAAQTPMMYGANGYAMDPPKPAPQFASFDSGGKTPGVNADALPAMPSWSTAREKRVEDEPPESESIPLQEQKQPLVSPKEQMYDDSGSAMDHNSTTKTTPTLPSIAGSVLGTHPKPFHDAYASPYGAEAEAQDTSYGGPGTGMAAGAAGAGLAAGAIAAGQRSRDPRYQNSPRNSPRPTYTQPRSNAMELDSSEPPISPITTSTMYTQQPPPSYRTNPRSGPGSQRGPPNPYGNSRSPGPPRRMDTYGSQGGGSFNELPTTPDGGSFYPPDRRHNQSPGFRSQSPASMRPGPDYLSGQSRGPPGGYRPYAPQRGPPPSELGGSDYTGYGPSESTVYEAPGSENYGPPSNQRFEIGHDRNQSMAYARSRRQGPSPRDQRYEPASQPYEQNQGYNAYSQGQDQRYEMPSSNLPPRRPVNGSWREV